MNLPREFEERLKELLGEEFKDYYDSFQDKSYAGLRVNTLKTTPEAFENISPISLNKIPWTKNGYYYKEDYKPAKHPYYYAGLYYIQEPSAMVPAALLPIEEGDRVLDLCAAPGGKSTELAAKLNGSGVLVSNDISNSRAKALLKNIELAGVKNAIVTSEDPKKLVKYFEGYFDKILVDAPCSGEGMFRREPSMIKNWEEYGVEYYSRIQKEIILYAAKMLKPGGLLLYSTCTFSPEENEGTIQYLLDETKEFKVVKADRYDGFEHGMPETVGGDSSLSQCVRLWPHKVKGEGHFAALLQKIEGEERVQSRTFNKSGKAGKQNINVKNEVIITEELKQFLGDVNLKLDKNRFELREEKLYYLPEGFVGLTGLRVLRSGLYLGDIKKKRFEPSQAFASALGAYDYKRTIILNVEDERVIRYLKGETIEVEGEYGNGWYLICVDGYSLGWGKLNGTTLKNKYYSGWRWLG